jgi:NCK-associated protein 1
MTDCVQGHANNIHCLALAVNQLLGCLFSLGGHDDIEDRLKVRGPPVLS